MSSTLNVLRWNATGKATSLVVICHGVGADGSQIEVFVDALAPDLPGVAFLAPHAPDPFEHFPLGRQWFSLSDRTPAILQAGAARAAPLLDATIDAECARLGLSPGRVILAGFSQGAMMALYTGLRRRPAPLAILAYSGALLDTPELEHALSGRPPILLVHGEADEVVPFARGPEAAAALRRLGLPVQTCWCAGTGHSVDAAGLQAGRDTLQAILATVPEAAGPPLGR